MHSGMTLHHRRKAGWNAGFSGCSLGDCSRACLQSAAKLQLLSGGILSVVLEQGGSGAGPVAHPKYR